MCELHHVLLVWIRLKSWLIQGKSLLKSSRPLALLRHAPSAACGQNCNKIGGYGFKSLLRKSKLLNHSNHYTFNNAEYPIGSTCSTIAITEEYKCGKPNAINPKKMRFSYIDIYWFIMVYRVYHIRVPTFRKVPPWGSRSWQRPSGLAESVGV